jgi:hypothetical protein
MSAAGRGGGMLSVSMILYGMSRIVLRIYALKDGDVVVSMSNGAESGRCQRRCWRLVVSWWWWWCYIYTSV